MRIWRLVGLALAVMAGAVAAQEPRPGRDIFRGALKRFTAPASPAPAAPPTANGRVRVYSYAAKTTDGWKLVVDRYWVANRLDRKRLPVVLCHGFGYNGRFFDLAPAVSLAGYLAENGFDVWVVNLRGCGRSSKWALGAQGGAEALVGRLTDKLEGNRIPTAGFVSLDPKYARWNLDDHVNGDVPAVLKLVREQTGASQVSWLGHSMGGIVMLAYLCKYGQDPAVGRLCTVGSQLTMPDGQLVVQFLFELIEQRERQIAGGAFRPADVFASMNNVFFNEHNADPAVISELLARGNDMPSVGVLQQYLAMSQTGRLSEARGGSGGQRLTYADGLGKIQCPCLIVGGSADQIAPPAAQQVLVERLGSSDKTYLFLGHAAGFRADYGHNDSLIGRGARDEVYPLLARWLAGQSIPAPPLRR